MKEKGRSRKKKEFPVKAIAIAGAVMIAAAGIGAGYYIYRGKQYKSVFFPNTTINGIDASGKTVAHMRALISETADDYVLTIRKRGGGIEEIAGKDIDLHSVFDGALEAYLAKQNPMEWWGQKKEEKDYKIETMTEFDEEKLKSQIEGLELFDREKMEPPKDAYLSEYLPGQGYVVVPEEPGTVLDKEKTAKAIEKAVRELKEEVDLEELDVYEKAAVTSDDRELHALADRLNRYVNVTITYTFGEKQEVLGGELISQWVTLGEGEEVNVDQEAVTAYVKELADKYNTVSKPKVLKTSYGETVEIDKGTYGWRIDQAAEAEQLYQLLMSGESQVREPVYKQEGASHGENDYGDTYVEINLTAQHLYFYKDGQLVVESDFVSGNAARGYDTPSGVYPLSYKQRNATLKGQGYATPVSYWMPFNGNIGMHDATWRGSFGGNIYKTNGSHGCINLPKAAARTIFENIEKGMPVLCYRLGGTEKTKSSSGGAAASAAPPPAAPAVAAPPAAPPVTENPAAESAPPAEESQSPKTEGGQEESSSEEPETTRHKALWEYGPGTTQVSTEAQNTESQPEMPQEGGGSADTGENQPETQPETQPAPSDETQEVGPGV